MSAKQKNLSPAKAREAAAKSALAAANVEAKEPSWSKWESKIDRIRGRSSDHVLRGWLAHVPDIDPPGSPPREGISSISAIDAILPRVPRTGEIVEPISGARSGVLHEAYYLAHKAVHVEITCANFVSSGRHTWAVVDAYQASLFALASIMCFLGMTVERADNDFVLVDVWGATQDEVNGKRGPANRETEAYQFLRFKTLDHFHKWAILKRVLRTLDTASPLVVLLRDALNEHDDKEFARYRNTVNYQSAGWIANDLLEVDFQGPIKQAQSSQDLFNEIFSGTASGAVYLMCALIELVCQFATELAKSGMLAPELALLDRRLPALKTLTNFDWNTL
ncbi:hypothetical protein [Paraburkholderia sartisoli]|uniref:Uncharacterized protein n=1 Tax=Paraburkholderia sartisoli TaxID=83784 RepID=A0A1H4G2I3_9BURK|nr:hypothetical protein [Paraburkholderia sartisoli]SEB03138.1 hypothetical protein SAMN05192564_105229 [Paraburkholderia sartisoli]